MPKKTQLVSQYLENIRRDTGEHRSRDGRWPFKNMNRKELFKIITWYLMSQTKERAIEGQSQTEEETSPTKSKVNRRFLETLRLNELARKRFKADPTPETQALLLRLTRHDVFSPLKRRARAVAIMHTFQAVIAQRHRDPPRIGCWKASALSIAVR